MGKEADRYFRVDPWCIREEGFDPDHSLVAESIFSLANETMGVRGYFEEGYTGETLQGSYFNGIYEREHIKKSGYKGIIQDTEFMVNSVDWLKVRIYIGSEQLDLHQGRTEDFVRTLDLRTGELERRFVWEDGKGHRVQFVFTRLLSMEQTALGAQRIQVMPLQNTEHITVEFRTDFGTEHRMYHTNYWQEEAVDAGDDWTSIRGVTTHTGKRLTSSAYYTVSRAKTGDIQTTGIELSERNTPESAGWELIRGDLFVGKRWSGDVEAGERLTFTRLVHHCIGEEQGLNLLRQTTYESLKVSNAAWWKKTWEQSDIVIHGDDENQQGIRYCIFQLFQTYHGAGDANNIGAKGLTGEAYNGNAFWDTETYCLPFYLSQDPAIARKLLMFRYRTLDDARARAEALDCKGAFYPIATISGKECCDLWQHASLQLQASTGVAYGIWLYEHVTGDKEFLVKEGLEMLIEISRMLASRGDWSADGESYGYYGVMGPDEFQMMVNHNCYTNYMGRFVLEYTLDTIAACHETGQPLPLEVSEDELEDWRKKASHMLILQDTATGVYEQHDGFFGLPHLNVREIPVEDFPLYSHWTYDRIYRNDMIKQPDVLMFLLLFNSRFSLETIRANYEYYEPRCIHESSLSPSVHSILAEQLGKDEEAFAFFRFATRMDLDNYNRNTGEGIHTTSIAAAWMNIVYGFGGMRSDGERLSLWPKMPAEWEGYTFHAVCDGQVLTVDVTRQKVGLWLKEPGNLELDLYGEPMTITEQKQEARLR